MKRSRGRSRKNTNSSNRQLDSSGPDVKIRGNASHIYDKYQALARDAASSGDRVTAENYLQHAEHYFRIMRAAGQAGKDKAAQAANGTAHAEGTPDDEDMVEAEAGQTPSEKPVSDSEESEEASVASAEPVAEAEAAPKPRRGKRQSRAKNENGSDNASEKANGRSKAASDSGESSKSVSDGDNVTEEASP